MTKKVFALSILIVLMFPAQSFAAFIKGAKINNVHMLSNGNFVIQIQTPIAATNSAPNGSSRCQSGGRLFHVYLGENAVTADGLPALYAMALTAISLDMKIGISFNDALQSNGVTSSCFLREIKLNDF